MSAVFRNNAHVVNVTVPPTFSSESTKAFFEVLERAAASDDPDIFVEYDGESVSAWKTLIDLNELPLQDYKPLRDAIMQIPVKNVRQRMSFQAVVHDLDRIAGVGWGAYFTPAQCLTVELQNFITKSRSVRYDGVHSAETAVEAVLDIGAHLYRLVRKLVVVDELVAKEGKNTPLERHHLGLLLNLADFSHAKAESILGGSALSVVENDSDFDVEDDNAEGEAPLTEAEVDAILEDAERPGVTRDPGTHRSAN